MTTLRVTVRAPRGGITHWLTVGSVSLLLHVALFLTAVFLPRLLSPSDRFPPVYTVDLVSLPAGPLGPPAEGARASAPAPAPAPPKQEPAVKIPEKPIPPPAKPVKKKAEPPRPKAVKVPVEPKVKTGAPPKPSPVGSEEGGTGTTETPAATGGSSGGPGGVPGGAGGGGGSLLVGDASFEYGWYLARMQALIEQNWSRPILTDLTQTLRAGVRFTIRREGTLTGIELAQSSGDAAVDRSALRAVNASSPLPPLPYEYGKDSLPITIFFNLRPE